jgi:hypothetical protein
MVDWVMRRMAEHFAADVESLGQIDHIRLKKRQIGSDPTPDRLRKDFIGIDKNHPVELALKNLQGEVPLVSEAGPGPGQNAAISALGDVDGGVLASRIDNDHRNSRRNRIQAGRQINSLVLGEDCGGEAGRVAHISPNRLSCG